ncbi:flagellar brake protein [Pseudomonadota bacterium]
MNKLHQSLSVGTLLHLQPTTQNPEGSFDVQLIGYMPGESLLVSQPINNTAAVKLIAGAAYQARIISGDSTYAFETEVIRVCDQPYQYMHLRFPKGVQGVTLRRAQRTQINESQLTLNMQDGLTSLSVKMLDISPLGACLISEHPLGKVGDFFCIDVHHKSTADTLAFPCTIRHINKASVKETGPAYYHGVEFSRLDTKALNFISHFIRDNVAKQRTA